MWRPHIFHLVFRFAVQGDTITYYGTARAQPWQTNLRTGEAIQLDTLPPDRDLVSTFEVTKGGILGLWGAQTHTLRRWEGDRWTAPVKVEHDWEGGLRPCGALADHTPIAAWYRDGQVMLVALDADYRRDRVVWSAKVPEGDWGMGSRFSATSCGMVGAGRTARVVFGQVNQTLVFEGARVVSVIGTDDSVFAHDAATVSALLGDGEVLVVAERDQPKLHVYARELRNPKAAQASAEPLTRLRAGVVGQARWQAMWDLGWWELLEDEARAAKQLAWAARARARRVVFWTGTGPPGEAAISATSIDQLDDDYLAEIEPLVAQFPEDPWLRLAEARLRARLGQASDAIKALVQLEPLLPAFGLDAGQVPELFDIAAGRGDVVGMRRLHAGLDPDRDGLRKAVWEAAIARMEGRGAEHLAALQARGDERDALVARAQIYADLGRLDESVATWMRAERAAPGDPQVLGGLGLAYLRRGLPELAAEALFKAVDGDPANDAHRSNLAAALVRLGKDTDALKQLYMALGEHSEDVVLQHQVQAVQAKDSEPPAKAAVAVLPFDVGGERWARVGMGELLASMVSTALVQAKVAVIEPQAAAQLAAERQLQTSGRLDPATVSHVSQTLAVADLVTGTVAEFDEHVVVTVQRHRNGRVVAEAHARADLDAAALREAMARVVMNIRP